MRRQLILALGLLALSFGLAARPALAADPPAGGSDKEAHAVSAAGPGAHGPEGAGKDPDILEPQPSLAIWTVVVFIGLFLVLARFAWKPLLNALRQREEHLEHCLLETERARNERERLLAEHRRQMEQAANEVRALIEQARRDATASAEEILAKARAEAAAERQRAKADIENARDQALMEIYRSKTADLAVSVASRVLTRQIDESEHRRLVERPIGELPAHPTGRNGHGGLIA